MIFIDRARRDEAGQPIQPDARWFERARAATARALLDGAAHEIRADIYGHLEVRRALEKLFHDKCAYCESKVTASFDWEVEHFRPKRGVTERPDHPGYYWLAYEWTNLYPACVFCNQLRRERSRWGETSRRSEAAGKAHSFPLEDESGRAMRPGDDLANERPLFLDPCADQPEEFLTFDVQGQALSVAGNRRGQTTCEVLLQRKRLRDRRRSIVTTVVELLDYLSSPGITAELRGDLLAWLQRNYLEDAAEYSGVGRAVLRDPAAFGVRDPESGR
jgi:uncharacterized protein (TIGR02646 family)